VLRQVGNLEGEASTLDSLGYAHQQLGNHTESVTWYQRALDLYSEIGHHCGYAETLGRLGDANQAAGDLGKARTAWKDALAILDDLHHPDAVRIRAKLSDP
jgi:tetratricopeptide (TPR) repeat protein